MKTNNDLGQHLALLRQNETSEMGTDSHCALQDKPDGQSDSAMRKDQVCLEEVPCNGSQGYAEVAAGRPKAPTLGSGESEVWGCLVGVSDRLGDWDGEPQGVFSFLGQNSCQSQ